MSSTIDYRVISIGALGAHPLWNEKGEVRPAHMTTTLVRSDGATVLVDPSLPAAALESRLDERAGIRPEEVTHVFLTSFLPVNRRGLERFEEATWLIAEGEREAIGQLLVEQFRDAEAARDDELAETLRREIALLRRCEAAPDRIAEGIDLFPLPGVSPGTCGLLLPAPRATVVVCGDAVPTLEHLEAGRIHAPCHDVERARESFTEVIEIADLIIPGRDNLVMNPLRRPF